MRRAYEGRARLRAGDSEAAVRLKIDDVGDLRWRGQLLDAIPAAPCFAHGPVSVALLDGDEVGLTGDGASGRALARDDPPQGCRPHGIPWRCR